MNSSWWVPGSSLLLLLGEGTWRQEEPPAAQSPGRKAEASEGMQGCGESQGGGAEREREEGTWKALEPRLLSSRSQLSPPRCPGQHRTSASREVRYY